MHGIIIIIFLLRFNLKSYSYGNISKALGAPMNLKLFFISFFFPSHRFIQGPGALMRLNIVYPHGQPAAASVRGNRPCVRYGNKTVTTVH